jgi:hypothetical protein
MTSSPLVVHGIIVILLATNIKKSFYQQEMLKNYDTNNFNRKSTNHFISGAR